MVTTHTSVFASSGVQFAETLAFDKLLIDYINDNELLKEFYEFDDSNEGVKNRINSYKNIRIDRNLLSRNLLQQYRIIKDIPQIVLENIDSLKSEKTFTISTGHQLNIFSGPLYVFYKLVSAINMAKHFKQLYPEYNFVPVYWMAAEDHDMEEISVLYLFGKEIRWNSEWKGMSGGAPVKDLEPVISEVESVFGNSEFAGTLKDMIRDAYTTSDNLADATRKWTNALFGRYGLVIVDGNDASLKERFSDVMIDELQGGTSFKIVNESTENLKKHYHLQVNPREINLFYTGDNFRSRIVKDEHHFKVLDSEKSFSEEEILNEVKNHPEKFSPNVVLRPLYQESILPNIIYTGGPAEIAYWLELKSVFNHYYVPMPVLFMRSSAMVIDANTNSLLQKYSINQSDIFKPVDELIREFIDTIDGVETKSIMDLLSTQMDDLSKEAASYDPTLRATVESEKQRMMNSLQTLEQKIIRAAKKKNENDVNKIRKVKEKLFPDGKLQERQTSALTYLLQWGPEFIDILLKNLNPLDKKFILLREGPDSES
jgi:bacillithiol biosynthesis cysteine-adding enzyme BshC